MRSVYLCGGNPIFGVVETVDVFDCGIFEFRGIDGPVAGGGDEEEGRGAIREAISMLLTSKRR